MVDTDNPFRSAQDMFSKKEEPAVWQCLVTNSRRAFCPFPTSFQSTHPHHLSMKELVFRLGTAGLVSGKPSNAEVIGF
jgi:hypothetical protein